MGRGVVELGPRAELRVDRHDASGWGRAFTANPGGESKAGGHALPRLREASIENPQSETCVAPSVTHGFNTRSQPRFPANRTRHRRCLSDTEAAAQCENRKWCAPETGAELAAVGCDGQRTDEPHAGQQEPCLGLPLRADEQAAQPRRCDPRKHPTPPSKARACRLDTAKDGSGSSLALAAAGGKAEAATNADR
jgi:hypothetical protein